MDKATFERRRLQLFSENDFKGESKSIADRDGRNSYLISAGEGPRPTILLHGGLSEASVWHLLAAHLRGQVVIPDRPGFGLSYRIDYRHVDFRSAAADWLLDLVDGLEAQQVDLVASSIGGFFAMAFAIRHTERVRRLVLVGAPAGLDKSLPLFPRLWGNPISGRLIGKLVVNTKSPEDVRKRAFPLLVAHPERLSVEFLELSLAAQKLAGTDVAAHTMLRSVSTLRGWRDHLLMRDDLAKLPLPTLFVWGEKDAFAPPSSGVDMVARMPDARIETIENAGHLPHLDDPLAIAENINPFLAS